VASGAIHPKQAKTELARRIVADFHPADEADAAAASFERRFTKGEVDRSSLEVRQWTLPEENKPFRQVLVQLKLAASGSEADQKLKQGGVKLDGQRIEGPFTIQQEKLERGRDYVLEIGRRAYLLRVI
jgi:tyrosyl-tRNA synthetase